MEVNLNYIHLHSWSLCCEYISRNFHYLCDVNIIDCFVFDLRNPNEPEGFSGYFLTQKKIGQVYSGTMETK